jgi:hypothetical protein
MSIWQKGKIPGQERRFALGSWLPRRKLASPAYVPSPRARRGLRYKKNVWYSGTQTLAPGATGYIRASVAPGFALMMILGQATQAGNPDGQGSFQVQIFDTARRQGFSEKAIADVSGVGTAQNPFILKNPYRFTGTVPLLCKVQNHSTLANKITVVFYGVSD